MKKLIVILGLILVSCKDNYLVEKYPDGSLKSQTEINSEGLADGKYKEYFKSGELKVLTLYKDGVVNDTVYHYFKNGIVKEKGLFKDGKKYGWWKLYKESGLLYKMEDYYLSNNRLYINQWIALDAKGDTLFNHSKFYNLFIDDTLKLGKNIGRIKYNSDSRTDNKFYEIAIDNQISETLIEKDTFYEEKGLTRFGIYAHKPGKKIIKGTIIETIFDKYKITDNSIRVDEKKRITLFEKVLYVK